MLGLTTMLYEVQCRSDLDGEPYRRRWFTDDFFDLFVWYADDRQVLGFQLCYDKPGNEHALTWRRDAGFSHRRVDDGDRCQRNATEWLMPDGVFSGSRLLARFLAESRAVDPDLVDLVRSRIEEFGQV